MKTMFFLLCVAFTANVFAQEPSAQTIRGTLEKQIDSAFRTKNIHLKSKPDTGIDKNILPFNGMPNAFSRKSQPDIYVGNNGQGQDIYRAQLDNMPILKPDSSFQAGGIPNALKRYDLKSFTVPTDPAIPPGAWRGQPKPGTKTPNKK